MSDLVNLVLYILVLPTKKVQCLMSVRSKPRVFKYLYQLMLSPCSFDV